MDDYLIHTDTYYLHKPFFLVSPSCSPPCHDMIWTHRTGQASSSNSSGSHSVVSDSSRLHGLSHQAPLSKRFSRQEYWSGLPFPSPGDLPNPVTEPRFPALQVDSLLSGPLGKEAHSVAYEDTRLGGFSAAEAGAEQNLCSSLTYTLLTPAKSLLITMTYFPPKQQPRQLNSLPRNDCVGAFWRPRWPPLHARNSTHLYI